MLPVGGGRSAARHLIGENSGLGTAPSGARPQGISNLFRMRAIFAACSLHLPKQLKKKLCDGGRVEVVPARVDFPRSRIATGERRMSKDNRKHHRRACDQTAWILYPDGSHRPCSLRDVSLEGARICVAQ